jgi:thiamine biosynthesis protein ThiS
MSATTDKITLRVNGEVLDLPHGATLAALIARIGLDTRKVAVELNREIVPRSTYAAVVLAQDDVLEIVHFIGGG